MWKETKKKEKAGTQKKNEAVIGVLITEDKRRLGKEA